MTLEERELVGAKLRRKRQQQIRKSRQRIAMVIGLSVGVLIIGFLRGEKETEQAKNYSNENGKFHIKAAESIEDILEGGMFDNQQMQISTKLEHIRSSDKYPDALVSLVERNLETLDFVYHYPDLKDTKWQGDLSQELKANTIWALNQWDPRWGYEIYSGGFFGQTGCGPTCLSVVVMHLLQDPTLTPIQMMQFAQQNGYSVDGHGSTWTLFGEGAQKLGLVVEECPLNKKSITNSLDAGNLIVTVVKEGDFTDEGHFIVIRGWDENGFYVYDPNSKLHSQKQWTYEQIADQMSVIWSVGAP